MAKLDYIKLHTGLAIYKQTGSKNWYLYLNTDKEELRKSLRTSDKDKAIELAWEEKTLAKIKVDNNIPLKEARKTVKKVADLVIKELKAKKIQKTTYRDYINRLEAFGEFYKNKPISELDMADMNDFYVDNEITSKTRITITKTAFNMLFKCAVMNRYIQSNEIPLFPDIEADDFEEKQYFNKSELEVFFDKSNIYRFIDNAKTAKSKEARKYFFPMCLWLLHTGSRTGKEVNSLIWRDIADTGLKYKGEQIPVNDFIYDYKGILSANIRKGKTEKAGGRTIPLNMRAYLALLRLCQVKYNTTDVKKVMKQHRDDEIFSRKAGAKINFIDVFNQYIETIKSDLRVDNNQTLYSFRHTTATSLLSRKPALNTHLVSRYLGSSSAMLDKHYSKMLAMMKAHELVEIELDEKMDNIAYLYWFNNLSIIVIVLYTLRNPVLSDFKNTLAALSGSRLNR